MRERKRPLAAPNKAVLEYCKMDMAIDQNPQSLAERIKEARVRAGLSQVELARRCGVSPSLICTLESGRTKSLRHSTLLQMAKVLKQSPYRLAYGDGQMLSFAGPLPRTTFEQTFLADFRKLPPSEKKLVVRMVHSLATDK